MNKPSKKSRRTLLKRSVAAGAVLVSFSEAHTQWAKPLVNVVLLPAHAQTTTCLGDVTCVGVPSSGTPVTEAQEIKVSFALVPNPGIPVWITFTATCDGGLSKSGTFKRETKADGTIEFFASAQGEDCSAGSLLGIEARCGQGKTGRCEWPVIQHNRVAAASKTLQLSGVNQGKAWHSRD